MPSIDSLIHFRASDGLPKANKAWEMWTDSTILSVLQSLSNPAERLSTSRERARTVTFLVGRSSIIIAAALMNFCLGPSIELRDLRFAVDCFLPAT